LDKVTVHLRRSFSIFNIVAAIFFIIYLWQAYSLYQRSNEATIHARRATNWLLNLKNVDVDNAKLKLSVSDLVSASDNQYANEVHQNIKKLKEDIAKQDTLPCPTAQQKKDFIVIKGLVSNKLSIIEHIVDNKGQNDAAFEEAGRAMARINKNIDATFDIMEHTASADFESRRAVSRAFAQYKLVFSIASYVLLILFLIFILFKTNQNIRKRLLAEALANVNREKYETLVESSGLTMLIIDKKGRINFASKTVKDLSGYMPQDLINTYLFDWITDGERQKISEIIKRTTADQNNTSTISFQLRVSDGKYKWVSCKIFAIDKETAVHSAAEVHWQVVLWDIDEEKKLLIEVEMMEAQQLKQQKIIQDIIDTIPAMIFTKDVHGKYELVNQKMADLIGLPKAQIVGRYDKDILNHEKYSDNYNTDRELLRKRAIVKYDDVIEKNGEKQYLSVTKFPLLGESGEVRNICGVIIDVSDSKANEHSLISAKKEAENARVAQETFLANMSHEIRTPMNGIIGMTNLLVSTTLDKDQKEFTENIHESAITLLSLINDILDFSKIRSGKFVLENSPFKIRQVIKKAIYPMQFNAEDKELKLNLHIDNNLPEILIGDPLRLQQIIINLTGNAIKFTSKGAIDISVSAVITDVRKMSLQIDIADTGIGIPENKIDYIFESFAQNNADTSRKYGGTGLGLAIVKQLVELQGGKIVLKSVLNKGSVFTFTIPYAIGTNAPVQDTKNIAADSKNLLAGINILVAEDNIINQKVVRHTLQRQGANIEIANNGQQAIDMIAARDFDMILMDLQMPEVDGYKATIHIKTVLNKAVPVVAMTADALKGEEEKCIEAGMVAYISKPFHPHDLYQLILQVTKDRIQVNNTQQNQAHMSQPLLDMTFLYDISDNDPTYIYDVIDLFLGAMPEGLVKLNKLLNETDDWEAIHKQSHFLKSGVTVIKVGNVFDELDKIEALSRKHEGKAEMITIMKNINAAFNEVIPELLAIKEKNKPASA